jgi:hypothetical protein
VPLYDRVMSTSCKREFFDARQIKKTKKKMDIFHVAARFNTMPYINIQVTWVEHVEVDDRGVHNLYKQLVSSGHGFGAKRWVATLDRQCERLASAMATNIPTGDVGGN